MGLKMSMSMNIIQLFGIANIGFSCFSWGEEELLAVELDENDRIDKDNNPVASLSSILFSRLKDEAINNLERCLIQLEYAFRQVRVEKVNGKSIIVFYGLHYEES